MLVEQEDGNPCSREQLVDLGPSLLALLLACVAVDGRLPDAVRLVEDQAVEVVGFGSHEGVEVLEEFLHPRRPGSGDAPQRLGEGARAGRVHHGPALTGELAHQGERDDGLAATGAAADDDRSLRVRSSGPLDGVQDVLVGVALLVEEDEHLPSLHLVCGDCQQLAARRDA